MHSRTLVIGDIHGCLSSFDSLLDAIAPTGDDQLILLGDYVDRGPDSASVMKRILGLSNRVHLTAIKGNHEQMMLDARDSHDKFALWLFEGGDVTLRSYGGARGGLRDIPTSHWTFLENQLVNYLETESHIFVHAGAHSNLAMSEQPDYVLRWERVETITAHQSGKVIVCGHTPQTAGHPLNRGYIICLDTNACCGGPLTCMDVGSGRIWQAGATGRVSRAHISDFPAE